MATYARANIDPHPPHRQQQHQRLQNSSDAQVVQQQVGELGHSEDKDQVEEQLQGRNALLATVRSSQRPPVIGDVHHIHPLCSSRLTKGGAVRFILPCVEVLVAASEVGPIP